MGNKTKYSKAIVRKICRYIQDGLNNKQACQAAGVSETSLLVWRKVYPEFAEKVEQAREVMRAKVLAKIKEAGKDDWRAHAEFLRLAFAEYRFGNSPQVNVAIQQNTMQLTDPERAQLIERREKALAATAKPKQLEDARDARQEAEAAERTLAEPQEPPPKQLLLPKPKPMNIVERAGDQLQRMKREGWRSAEDCEDIDEILD